MKFIVFCLWVGAIALRLQVLSDLIGWFLNYHLTLFHVAGLVLLFAVMMWRLVPEKPKRDPGEVIFESIGLSLFAWGAGWALHYTMI